MELFLKEVCEFEDAGICYIHRRNSILVEGVLVMLFHKRMCNGEILEKKNTCLQKRPRAKVSTSVREVEKKIKSL